MERPYRRAQTRVKRAWFPAGVDSLVGGGTTSGVMTTSDEARTVLAIDLGGTKAAFAVVDSEGAVLSH